MHEDFIFPPQITVNFRYFIHVTNLDILRLSVQPMSIYRVICVHNSSFRLMKSFNVLICLSRGLNTYVHCTVGTLLAQLI